MGILGSSIAFLHGPLCPHHEGAQPSLNTVFVAFLSVTKFLIKGYLVKEGFASAHCWRLQPILAAGM